MSVAATPLHAGELIGAAQAGQRSRPLLPALPAVRLDSRRLAFAVAFAAMACGCWLRISRVMEQSFPLGDGGMFLVMVQDLVAHHLELPRFTSYNGGQIPFAYPPLALYAGALLNLAGVGAFEVVRAIPLLATCLTLPAFWLLANTALPSRWSAAAATCAFALIPRSFLWLVMGGGLTRAPGFLFAILALQQLLVVQRAPRKVNVTAAGLLCGLTILTHTQTAWFLALSAAYFLVWSGRSRRSLLNATWVAVIAAAASAPWWAAVVVRDGLAPILAAARSGGAGLPAAELLADTGWRIALLFAQTSEPIPVVGFAAVAGLVLVITRKHYFLPGWWLLTLVLEPRAQATYASLPEALLAGVAAVWFAEWLCDSRPRRLILAPAAALLLTSSIMATSTANGTSAGELGELVPLSQSDQTAMAWAKDNTAPGSVFVVVPTTSGWASDRVSEWFPALASRQSTLTVQGGEWLPGFDDRVAAWNHLRDSCQNDDCLAGRRFDYVYLPLNCCSSLASSLQADARYSLVYQADGVNIFRQTASPAA